MVLDVETRSTKWEIVNVGEVIGFLELMYLGKVTMFNFGVVVLNHRKYVMWGKVNLNFLGIMTMMILHFREEISRREGGTNLCKMVVDIKRLGRTETSKLGFAFMEMMMLSVMWFSFVRMLFSTVCLSFIRIPERNCMALVTGSMMLTGLL